MIILIYTCNFCHNTRTTVIAIDPMISQYINRNRIVIDLICIHNNIIIKKPPVLFQYIIVLTKVNISNAEQSQSWCALENIEIQILYCWQNNELINWKVINVPGISNEPLFSSVLRLVNYWSNDTANNNVLLWANKKVVLAIKNRFN